MVKTDAQTIKTILERGVVDAIVRDELEKTLKSGKRLRVKLGIDPTGSQLHIGHGVVLRKLKHFQDAGHQIILLIGDYTARVGDPSGRSETRPMLTEEKIHENMKRYVEQASKIIDIDQVEIRHNSEWFSKMTFAELLTLTSTKTVAQILQRKDFKERFANDVDISMTEILYPLMQGYDSVALKADIEIGGTDQLFNLLMGRPLQKFYGQEGQNILTVPILEGLDGVEKMSKSLKNFIGIEDSPNDMYGKTMSIPDHLIYKYFELATDISFDELEKVKEALNTRENPRNLKMKLASTLVTLYHDEDMAKNAENYFIQLFQKKEIPDDVQTVNLEQKEWKLVDLISELKLSPSKSEARRSMEGGGVKVNGEKITDINAVIHISPEMILQVGKRGIVKLK